MIVCCIQDDQIVSVNDLVFSCWVLDQMLVILWWLFVKGLKIVYCMVLWVIVVLIRRKVILVNEVINMMFKKIFIVVQKVSVWFIV